MPRDTPDPSGAAPPQRLHGVHSVVEALRARRRLLLRLRVRKGPMGAGVREAVEAARAGGVPIEEVDASELADTRSGAPTQGLELWVGPLPELSLGEVAARGESPRMLIALDGVEDPQNVGATARVAEAAGATGLVLTRRRASPLSPAVARASAGAIEWLPAARVSNLRQALKELKTLGFWVFGASPERGDDLFALPDRLLRGDRVLVLGAEGPGLRRGTELVVDHHIRIPTTGHVGSLNVATAAAVALFEFARRSRVASSP